jgi:two-component system OmpR family sensor kinase
MASLLTALLTLAREGDTPAYARPVSLARAAAEAYERWAVPAEEEGRELELVGGRDAYVSASQADVAIVLDNLVENALRYSTGAVSIDWGSDRGEGWLAVLDDGPGLAPGEETRLFERFARGRAGSERPGSGLGLAIVQTLARRWRGEATLTNRPEGGTRGEVRLPVAVGVPEESWLAASR